MKKLLLFCAFSIGMVAIGSAQVVHKKLVLFENNKAELTQVSVNGLNAYFDQLNSDAQIQVEMLGFIDRDMRTEDYDALLRQRAEVISSFFAEHGASSNQIQILAAEVNPLMLPSQAKRDSLSNWMVYVDVDKPHRDYVEPETDDIAETFTKRGTSFTINPNRKLRVIGKEGTKLTAPRSAFMFADGSDVEDDVDIRLREYYKVSDMMLAGLVTTSNGRMIETGGMMHITAECKDQEVFLKPGKSMQIELPLKGEEQKAGMQLFLGNTSGDIVNWNAAGGELSAGTDINLSLNGQDEVDAGVLDGVNLTYDDESININEMNLTGNRDTDNSAYETLINVNSRSIGRNQVVDGYLLETTTLGWINCDRFYEVEHKTDLIIAMDTTLMPSIRLVFTDIKSIMPGYYNAVSNQYQFSSLPVGYKATLIAFSIVDDQHYYSSKDVTITENGIEDMELAAVTKAKMKSNFARLN
jgi:hypothetical protein